MNQNDEEYNTTKAGIAQNVDRPFPVDVVPPINLKIRPETIFMFLFRHNSSINTNKKIENFAFICPRNKGKKTKT